MRRGTKAAAMLGLWASVKRAQDATPRDRDDAGQLEGPPRPAARPERIGPAQAAE